MPKKNKKSTAAKRRMQALRLRYLNGLRNKPVEIVEEKVEEIQVCDFVWQIIQWEPTGLFFLLAF